MNKSQQHYEQQKYEAQCKIVLDAQTREAVSSQQVLQLQKNLKKMPHKNNRFNRYSFSFQHVGRLEQLFLFLFFMVLTRIISSKTLRETQTCNDILPIVEDINIHVVCDETMKKIYLDSPGRYQQDMLQLHTILSDMIINQPYMYCKVAKITENPKFKIQLRNTMPNDENLRAAYERIDRILMIKAQDLNRLYIKRVFHHEFHHAFIYVRNEMLKINLLASTLDGSALLLDKSTESLDIIQKEIEKKYGKPIKEVYYSQHPFGESKTANDQARNFAEIMGKCKERIELMISLVQKITNQLSKKNIPSDNKNIEELSDFYAFLAVAAKYEPFETQFEPYLNQMEEWINYGVRKNENFYELGNDRSPTPEEHHKVTFYLSKTFQIGKNRGILYGYTVNSFNPFDRVIAALLDARYLFNFLQDYYIDKKKDVILALLEIDAHLHERYEPFPDLFQYLFPELVQHHQKMNEPLFRECLKSPPKQRKPYSFEFFNTSAASKGKEFTHLTRTEL